MENNSIQPSLFELDELSNVKKEWVGMPEFIQEDQSPKFQIVVSFASYDDVKAFAKLLNMNVSPKTNSTWFPHRPHKKYTQGYGTKE